MREKHQRNHVVHFVVAFFTFFSLCCHLNDAKGPQFLINVPEFILILCTTKECIIFPALSLTFSSTLFRAVSRHFFCGRSSSDKFSLSPAWCNELNQFFFYCDFSSGSNRFAWFFSLFSFSFFLSLSSLFLASANYGDSFCFELNFWHSNVCARKKGFNSIWWKWNHICNKSERLQLICGLLKIHW